MKTKGIVLLTVASTSLLAAPAFAGDYRVPRLPDGTPDLQGVWTNATATPMERSPELGERRAFTEQEAAAISKAAIAAVAGEIVDHRVHHLGTGLARGADEPLQIGQHQIAQAALEIGVVHSRLFLEHPVLDVDDD